MVLVLPVAAQQFHPHREQPEQVSFLRSGAGKVWRAVVWSAKESFSTISSLFFQTIGFIYPKLSSTLESIGFFMFDLSTKVGGMMYLRQHQNQIEDLRNENGELAVRVARLQQDKDLALNERNQMQVERDQATQASDLLRVNHDQLQRENERIVGERDFEVQRRELLVQDNVLLGRERALALAQQERLQNQTDALVAQLDEARSARDEAIGELPQTPPGLADALERLQAFVNMKQKVLPENLMQEYP